MYLVSKTNWLFKFSLFWHCSVFLFSSSFFHHMMTLQTYLFEIRKKAFGRFFLVAKWSFFNFFWCVAHIIFLCARNQCTLNCRLCYFHFFAFFVQIFSVAHFKQKWAETLINCRLLIKQKKGDDTIAVSFLLYLINKITFQSICCIGHGSPVHDVPHP